VRIDANRGYVLDDKQPSNQVKRLQHRLGVAGKLCLGRRV